MTDSKMAEIHLEETKESHKHQDNGIYRFASLSDLLDKHQAIIKAKQEKERANNQNVDMQNEEDDPCEPNFKFVEAFDGFCSFSKAAGFIEDWIRTKKNNSTDFTNDFPALLERGKNTRAILLYLRTDATTGKSKLITNADGNPLHPEVKNVHQLIYTKELYETEDDYVFYFTINLLEHCCVRNEVPLIVIRIAWNHLKQLIDDDKLKLTEK